ncbi:MAG: glutamate-5-semialdehyde dehydrogenase [Clostridiales bacterium]|nr:glutamate-5-semialdehyde dehydrogenase [Clostridiales bacterium]
MELVEICKKAKETKAEIANLGTNEKNEALKAVAEALVAHAPEIIAANEKDLENGKKNHMPEGLLDRLMLNESRIAQIAEGLLQVAALEDPIGEVLSMKQRPNGLRIGKKRVPIGVVGMIYEARPNVTVDAFGLCFKTGNVVILKGGSDAIHSNIAIVSVIQKALESKQISKEAVSLIEDTSRETAAAFMKMNEYVDVLIPRGGAGLIKAVVNQATIPVIETGTGNCHIFVDESADFDMAIQIIMNAKTQRISVCNACESLVIHEKIVDEFMPKLAEALQTKSVEMHMDEKTYAATQKDGAVKKELIKPATEEDWGKEYLDYMISAKTVSSVEEAIAHINRYNTGHSEAIITENYTNAEKFLNEVDAACVYVNASTRFSDGFEFGFGAEIGISTQKLHARGPMGLEALTSTKYIIYGNGQVRP